MVTAVLLTLGPSSPGGPGEPVGPCSPWGGKTGKEYQHRGGVAGHKRVHMFDPSRYERKKKLLIFTSWKNMIWVKNSENIGRRC